MFQLSDNSLKDLLIIVAVLVTSFVLFSIFDVLEALVAFTKTHENLELDELISTAGIMSFCLTWFACRRLKESNHARNIAEQSTLQLQRSLSEINSLQKSIPICCYCNNLRDDKGAWGDLQTYINNNPDTEFSQGVCPECLEKRISEIEQQEDGSENQSVATG